MNYIKQNIVALVALIIAIAACFLPVSGPKQSFGAAVVTPTNYNNLTLSNQLITGGADLRTDGLATTSITLALTDLLGNTTIIENSATGTAYTLFMPSTTTLASFIPHAGDYAAFMIVNASTTGPTVTIASSTDGSFVVRTASTTAPTLVKGSFATFDCIRVVSNTGVIDCLLSPSNP